ncbi:MAG: P-type DNA transfer ATPase VirB11 [Coxiellaceae bacterium]|nr:P-type DNA transfer ATPase VirB11 [Coxiellaceae bacterium]
MIELFSPNAHGLLSPLSVWLNDPLVSELMINKPQQVYIEKKNVITAHGISEMTERHLVMLCQLIANESQQQLNQQYPLLSATLRDGSRVQIVLPPIAQYPTLAIRRQVISKATLAEYENLNFYTDIKKNVCDSNLLLKDLYQQKRWPDFIKAAIESKKNIVISGGTSSGKTTFLNSCLRHIPLTERIIVLEDTREIFLSQPNHVCLLSSKGQQGKSNISMQDLVQCSLRLRPDRIIVGEIRGSEICDFIAACSTGHDGCLTSVHANNPKAAIMRMLQLYKLNNVPSMTDRDILREINSVVDVVIQLEKTSTGRRLQDIHFNL